jgi:hypothetical protein
MTHRTTPPEPAETAPYYFKYIERVPAGDVCEILEAQRADIPRFLETIPEGESLSPYAPGKWNAREVVNHINDAERLFAHRAFWFARGLDSPLPSFDQDVAAAQNPSVDHRSWASYADEFRNTRAATLDLFRNLTEEAWMRHGIASDNPFTVRAIAYIIAGHVIHHIDILQQRWPIG